MASALSSHLYCGRQHLICSHRCALSPSVSCVMGAGTGKFRSTGELFLVGPGRAQACAVTARPPNTRSRARAPLAAAAAERARGTQAGLRSSCSQSVAFAQEASQRGQLLSLARASPFLYVLAVHHHDPGRTRTCNLWFRRPTPYPLGHRATCVSLAMFCVITD